MDDKVERNDPRSKPALAGIPRLPGSKKTEPYAVARMLVLEVIELTAWHRQRFESGEARIEMLAQLAALYGNDERVLEYLRDWEAGRTHPKADVVNVRHWLRNMPHIVDGMEFTLADVDERLTDEQIKMAVAIWCRPQRKPRKNEPKLAEKWAFFADLFNGLGLGPAWPASLKRTWQRWRRERAS